MRRYTRLYAIPETALSVLMPSAVLSAPGRPLCCCTCATLRQLALPKPPDAFFGVHDLTACAARKELKRWGLRIPAELTPVAFAGEHHATLV